MRLTAVWTSDLFTQKAVPYKICTAEDTLFFVKKTKRHEEKHLRYLMRKCPHTAVSPPHTTNRHI